MKFIEIRYIWEQPLEVNMPETPLTRAELAEKYPDAAWQRKLIEIMSLVGILRECVIRSTYKPSEALSDSIALSEAGVAVRTQLITKESVNAKDAKVLTLLATVYIEPLIDVEGTDLERLAFAIGEELKSGALLFPFVMGRQLYDRAVELFKEERDYLSHEDTLRLLDGTPQGVFQAGHYLIGPYGIFRTEWKRRSAPTTSVPLQHCADTACGLVHRVQLTTSIEAGVNRARPALNKVLDSISTDPSEWNGFVSDIVRDDRNSFDIHDGATIQYLIGDALSDSELRDLLSHGVTQTNGRMVEVLKLMGEGSKAGEVRVDMNRAEMLQILCLLSDSELTALLDSAIRDDVVEIPGDEVRRAKVNASHRSGSWRLRSEASRLGVRAIGRDPALPLLRLSTLARSLFDVESNAEMDDLSWILRGVVGDTPREQLEEFLRTANPATVVDTLVLARKSSARAVTEELGIPLLPVDSDMRDAILWKLGFPLPRARDHRDYYWALHDGLESLAKTATVDLSTTAEGLRSTSSDYFVSLEKFLFDSLVFATWALLFDHYGSHAPFVFLEPEARAFAIETLNAAAAEEEPRPLTDEPVLSAIVDGYIKLAKILRGLRGEELAHERSKDSYPKFAAKTQLQEFPFHASKPFLDLLPDAQVRLVDTLQKVGVGLNDSGIMTARNGLLHAKQRVPTVGELTEALRRARNALDELESIGCVRSTFELASGQVNAWGRATTTLKSNGRSISFSSPSAFEWLGLPSLSKPHYIVQGAIFAPPNEMLRFYEGFTSEYQRYWSNYPTRPEPGNRIVASQSESLAAAVETGSYAAARAGS